MVIFSQKNIILPSEDLLSIDYIKIISELTIFSCEELISVDYLGEKITYERIVATINVLSKQNIHKYINKYVQSQKTILTMGCRFGVLEGLI